VTGSTQEKWTAIGDQAGPVVPAVRPNQPKLLVLDHRVDQGGRCIDRFRPNVTWPSSLNRRRVRRILLRHLASMAA
jgi:hypothetical protein